MLAKVFGMMLSNTSRVGKEAWNTSPPTQHYIPITLDVLLLATTTQSDFKRPIAMMDQRVNLNFAALALIDDDDRNLRFDFLIQSVYKRKLESPTLRKPPRTLLPKLHGRAEISAPYGTPGYLVLLVVMT